MQQVYQLKHGKPYPSGSKYNEKGVNFSIFSRYAEQVELLLFSSADSDEPFQIIRLNKDINRTFFSWHVYVSKLPAGTWYTWRMNGQGQARDSGFRFEKEKHLLDPWAQAVSHKRWDRKAACIPGDNVLTSLRCMVTDDHYDWEGDVP